MRLEGSAFLAAGAPPGAIEIVECGTEDAVAWDDFVARSNGTYCHLYGWKSILERSYKLKTFYLAFQSRDAWAGALPLAVMPRLPGRETKAVSLPYCNYGGLLAAPGADPAALRIRAADYLRSRGVRSIEFRERAEGPAASTEVCMLRHLPATAGQLWGELGVKVRNQVRKAERSQLTITWGRDQVGSLYDIYAIKMGELGTPVHSPRFLIA